DREDCKLEVDAPCRDPMKAAPVRQILHHCASASTFGSSQYLAIFRSKTARHKKFMKATISSRWHSAELIEPRAGRADNVSRYWAKARRPSSVRNQVPLFFTIQRLCRPPVLSKRTFFSKRWGAESESPFS